MAKQTIFSRLNQTFGNGVSDATSMTFKKNTRQYNSLGADDVIFRTDNKEEYQQVLLQKQQGKLLSKQWKRAQYETGINSLSNLTQVQMMYREADLMDLFPEVGAALDIYMEEACFTGIENKMIKVTSKSERVKSIIEDLLYNRLSCNTVLPMVCRSTVKYGNTYMFLNITDDNGVIGWKQLPVYEMERFENGMDNPYSSGFTSINNLDIDKPDSTKFVWVGKNECTPYRNWQIAHFRLLYDSVYLPYGVSVLNKARRHWRMLSMMEDMMLMYRLERSVERRVFKVYVGAIDEHDVDAYMNNIANEFKRTPIIDPLTGQLDLRKSILSHSEDFFIPVRDPGDPSPIETLQAGQNLTAMDDIKFVQNKLCTALRVPKSFLNFEETTGDGKNLSMLDVRFTRTINRVQQMLLMELNKVCIIHLYLLGFTDELTNFQLSMNNPSSQAEMLELDNLSKKIEMAKSAVADPGNGLPIMSWTRACKEILGWSDKQINDNLEELRLEKALAAELEQTTAIIKRTGLFNKVDNLYGEPGAEYGNNQQQEGGDEAGGGLGGGFGGGFGDNLGGGLEGDLGGDMDTEGDMGGVEGDEPIGDTASAESAEPLQEAFFNRLLDKTLTERKNHENIHIQRTQYYQQKLKDKLNENQKQYENELNCPLYKETFLINEELNSIAENLEKKLNKK